MKKRNFIVLIAILISINTLHCQDQSEFKKLTELLSLKFNNSSTLKEKKNLTSSIKCDFLIRDANKEIEILYSLIPARNYKEGVLNKIYKSIALQSLIKISQKTKASIINENLITEFDSRNVKREFNADWGGTSSFILPSDKIENYKFCMMLFLYKKNKGLVITYFLFNNEKTGLKEAENNFHNLTFEKL